MALQCIDKILQINEYCFHNFHLPANISYINDNITEINDDSNALDNLQDKMNSLKKGNKFFFYSTLECLKNNTDSKYILIDRPGGNGKSYLQNVLIDFLQFNNIQFVFAA